MTAPLSPEERVAIEVEYAAAEHALDVWVDALIEARSLHADRRDVALILLHVMLEQVPMSGPVVGLMLVALDRLADVKEAQCESL